MLHRRSFLKGIAAALVAVPSIPKALAAAIKPTDPGPQFFVTAAGDISFNPAHPKKYATVLELHRFLQDHADNAMFEGDVMLDITDQNPSYRHTDTHIELINGFRVDDDCATHLYGGALIQDDGKTIYDSIGIS